MFKWDVREGLTLMALGALVGIVAFPMSRPIAAIGWVVALIGFVMWQVVARRDLRRRTGGPGGR